MKIIFQGFLFLICSCTFAQVDREKYEQFAVKTIASICDMQEAPCDVYIKEGNLCINKIVGVDVSAEDYLLTDTTVHKKRALDYCYALTRQLNSLKVINYLQGVDFHGMIKVKVTYRLRDNSDNDYTMVTFADDLYKISSYLNKDDFFSILSGP